MKFIGLGELSIQLLYPFFLPIISMVRKILFLIYAQYYSDYLFTSCSIFIRKVMWDFIFNIKTSVKKRY